MRALSFPIRAFVALLLACGVSSVSAAPSGVKDLVFSDSVFVDDPTVGKDPFFPRSKRNGRVNIVTNTPVLVLPTLPELLLKGIAVQKNKRVAIINNSTLEQGEESELRVEDRRFKVKLLEIRERSALVNIDGITKELTLRAGL